jgi:flagellar secretion chaperone FliS
VAHDELVRAQAILNELVCSLDHEQGGEVARNLAALYDFCLDRLVRANLDKDPALLGAVRSTLADLADAWSTMMRQDVSEPVLAAS